MTIIVFRMAGCHSKDLYMTFPACQNYNPKQIESRSICRLILNQNKQSHLRIWSDVFYWDLTTIMIITDPLFWDLFIFFVSFGVQFVWLPCIREKIHDTLWILIMWYIWIVYPFYHWLKGHWYACLIIVTTVPTRGSILFSSGVLQSIENAQMDALFQSWFRVCIKKNLLFLAMKILIILIPSIKRSKYTYPNAKYIKYTNQNTKYTNQNTNYTSTLFCRKFTHFLVYFLQLPK